MYCLLNSLHRMVLFCGWLVSTLRQCLWHQRRCGAVLVDVCCQGVRRAKLGVKLTRWECLKVSQLIPNPRVFHGIRTAMVQKCPEHTNVCETPMIVSVGMYWVKALVNISIIQYQL